MTSPMVSVCIATFNHKQYIHDCIMSVVAQGLDIDTEIIVGDDQSDDGTSAIVEKLVSEYPHLIRHFRHPKRIGGCMNYRFIVQLARGTFIAHLDGDDFWLPSKLSAQIRFLDQHPDCPAVYTNALTINDEGLLLGVFNSFQPARLDINALVRHGNFLNHSSMLYRATLRNNILSLPQSFLDYQIHLLHALHGDIGYLNKTLVCYRINSSNSIRIHANDLVRNLYWEALINTPRDSIYPKELAKGMAEFARSVFFKSISAKNLKLLLRWIPIVIQASPVKCIKMIYFIFLSIFRVGIQEIVNRICAGISKNQLKIFYPS